MLDRFTRDEVSAKIWWPLALLFVVALVLTFPGRSRAIEGVQSDAADWSVAVAEHSIAPVLADADLTEGLADEEPSLTAALEGASAGGSLRAVRIWGPDAALLFSTLGGDADDVGDRSQGALNDEQVEAALDGGGPVMVTAEEGSAQQFQVYVVVPDGPDAVAQFEFPESRLLEDVRSTWFRYQLIAGIAGILTLVFAALSTREPIARIGAKVPFYPTSIPKGSAVMDADEANALKESGHHARQRVAAMEGRLHELEEENRKLGGDLQRALTALSTTQRQGVPTAIPRAVAPRPAEPAAASAAPAEEITRPPREAKPARKRRPAPKLEPPPKVEPVPEPVREPEPEITVAEPDPVVVVLPEPDPEPEVAPQPEPPAAPVPSVAAAKPDLGPVYEETWASSVSDPEPMDDLLARITVPEAAPVSPEEASILRAKLARTAALKKPGSRERREASENGKE